MLIASCLPIAGYFFSGTEKIRKMITRLGLSKSLLAYSATKWMG